TQVPLSDASRSLDVDPTLEVARPPQNTVKIKPLKFIASRLGSLASGVLNGPRQVWAFVAGLPERLARRPARMPAA
ncbi:hypothetical protein, partial [uncultured Phenylobacterium sp.]|uniref:hypothetical protein n=1 Tax=uncultured Phenylobacterium sp. TaxID=349273 RepID=UPI0025D74455